MTSDYESIEPASSADHSMSHAVHRVLQFLRVVRYRKGVLVVAVLISGLLGGLYYAKATRLYQTDAEVLVLQAGGDVGVNSSMGIDGSKRELMPTYQQLVKSEVVLEGVFKTLPKEHRIDFSNVPRKDWVNVLSAGIQASTLRNTNIMRVQYQSKDPEAAVAVVNSLLDSYLAFVRSTHRSMAGQVKDVLMREEQALHTEIEQKDMEIQQLRQRYGDLRNSADSDMVHPAVRAAQEIYESLLEASGERVKREAALAAVQAAVRQGGDLRQHLLIVEESVGRAMLSTALGFGGGDIASQARYDQLLLEYRAEAKSLEEHLGPSHPKLVEVNDKIRLTMEHIKAYQENVNSRMSHLQDSELGPMLTEMMEQALAASWEHENAIRASYEKAHREAVQLNGELAQIGILQHARDRLGALHDVLVEKISATDLRQEHGSLRAKIIEEPRVQETHVTPNLERVVAGCLFFALVGGVLVVYVQDILDDRFRSPDELRMRLGVPALAMVPQFPPSSQRGMAAVQTFVNPNDSMSEAFRTLRTAIAFSDGETSRLAISSSEPGDGKTTVLVNLAVSLAQSGKKTLLIDGDLRRPGLTKLLDLGAEAGLSDVLRSEEDVVELARQNIRATEMEGLDVLPSGPRRPDPAELLAGPRLGDLLAWAETHYDQILVDSPPVLAASDVLMIGKLVDGVLLVIHPEKNRRRLVMRAVESFASMGVNILGMVANQIRPEDNKGYGYGYGYGYSYGYGEEEGELAGTSKVPEGTALESIPFTSPVGPSATAEGSGGIVPRKVA